MRFTMESSKRIWILLVTLSVIQNGHALFKRQKREDKIQVTTIIEPPFCIEKSDNVFEGFIPDLMKVIEEKTSLSFSWSKVEDGRYGVLNNQGQWIGMIGKVVNKEATIAAGPITITEERNKVVDFSVPFMSVDLSLLMLKQDDDARKITSAEDLANQTDLKYGIVKNGSTNLFFRNTKNPTYMKLMENMNKDELNFLASYKEGVNKVRSSLNPPQFGMIGESASADYYTTQAPCNLVSVNIINDIRNYGLAIVKNWPYTAQINTVLEELKKSGKLDQLKAKWWPGSCLENTGI